MIIHNVQQSILAYLSIKLRVLIYYKYLDYNILGIFRLIRLKYKISFSLYFKHLKKT